MPHMDSVEDSNWCAYTCGSVINGSDNQNLDTYNYQKTIILITDKAESRKTYFQRTRHKDSTPYKCI